jgi:hypothetical protein
MTLTGHEAPFQSGRPDKHRKQRQPDLWAMLENLAIWLLQNHQKSPCGLRFRSARHKP